MAAATDLYIERNKDRFLEELKAFLRIPSVSTAPERAGDVALAAEFVAASLRGAGLENVAIIPGVRHPLVYGDWLHAPGKPTVLCYGHYDVQPPDPLEEWTSPPFEPELRGGNLYARGSADDKGQMYMHIKAVETLRENSGGPLPLNLRFLIEGEEEIGGESIKRYLEQNAQKLRADVALVSDTAMYAAGMPTLCTGLRGLVYLELEAFGPARDLHSGLYGGAAPNPISGLIELLGKAKDGQGVIQIPGFYDGIVPPAALERASWEALPFSEREFLEKEVGAEKLTGDPGYSVLERIWARPALEVHGIAGGFTAAGAKTVIPARATAKVSFRLVPRQDPDKVIAAFRDFVARNTPEGIRAEVRVLSASPAVLVDTDHPAVRVAAKVFGEVFGSRTVFIRDGASVPVVGDFAKYLGIPSVMMGFGLPDDGLHAPNEKYRLENYFLGIATIARFFAEYGR